MTIAMPDNWTVELARLEEKWKLAALQTDKRLSELETELERIQKTLHAAEEEIVTTKLERGKLLESAKAELTALTSQLAELQSRIKALSDEASSRIKALSDEISSVDAQLQKILTALADIDSRLTAAEKRLTEIRASAVIID